MGEGHGWNQAACTPTQAQDPGKSLKRGSFFFFSFRLHQQYYRSIGYKRAGFSSHSSSKGKRPSISEEAGENTLLLCEDVLVDSGPHLEPRETQRGRRSIPTSEGVDADIRSQAASPSITSGASLYHSDPG